jgi:NAD(P)-dependent dehydrogenase (short-subunit alcohol dehydrogenase family)
MTDGKAVLITGASTGIGRACALGLAEHGFRVFAAVRKQSDADELVAASAGKLEAVLMDVVDYAAVREAARKLDAVLGEQGLYGLVNNAGISVTGPLEFLPIERFERQMTVNVTGQLAVTQAFLPLLRKARGRIVFMSSISGRFTLPMLGPYSASKHALEALANAFRLELSPAGIAVSLLEPGSIKSAIWEKAIQDNTALIAALPAEAKELYGAELKLLTTMPKQEEGRGASPEQALRAVLHALRSGSPKARYFVGADARVMIPFFALSPTRFADWVVTRGMRALSKRSPAS